MELTQVYCGDEKNVNKFMENNQYRINVKDVKITNTEYGEILMVVYTTDFLNDVEL